MKQSKDPNNMNNGELEVKASWLLLVPLSSSIGHNVLNKKLWPRTRSRQEHMVREGGGGSITQDTVPWCNVV